MNWMRYTAFAIGAVFGSLFLLFNLGTPLQRIPGFWETLTLLCGPLTLLAASFLGLKHERFAGWWLLAGAAATAVLFVVQLLPWRPGLARMLMVVAVFCLPMLCSGLLWLTHANAQPDGSKLPMMS